MEEKKRKQRIIIREKVCRTPILGPPPYLLFCDAFWVFLGESELPSRKKEDSIKPRVQKRRSPGELGLTVKRGRTGSLASFHLALTRCPRSRTGHKGLRRADKRGECQSDSDPRPRLDGKRRKADLDFTRLLGRGKGRDSPRTVG